MPDGSVAPATLAPEKPKRSSRVPAAPSAPWTPAQASSFSIADLARHGRAVSAGQDRLPKLSDGTPASDLAYDRMDALDDLILRMPARTLTEVVVQISRAMVIAQRISDDDGAGGRGDGTAMQRALASIMPVVIAASGADPAELVEPWALKQWEKHFGGLEQAMQGDAP